MVIANETDHKTDAEITTSSVEAVSGDLITKITAWARKYAERNGWVLNPDEEERNGILKGLAANCLRFGKQYCPCRIRRGDPETDKKIICPCIYHRDEIARDGHCHCRLFFRKTAAQGEQK